MDGELKELVLVATPQWEANKVSVSITLDDQVYNVWFTASEGLGTKEDFLLPLFLLPAMRAGSALKLPGELSPRLLSALPKIQDILSSWGAQHWGLGGQRLQRVAVDVEGQSGLADRASSVACFFSGGVDAFYSVLKHRDEITHLILVHGFDIPLGDQALWGQVSRMAHEVARELGKTLIEVETNIRSFSDELVSWEQYHGAALASVALLFQHRFRKVLIAATNAYTELMPWGSHPLLDPLWSTELTEIEHDGCDVTRTEKVAYISEYEVAMEWLRVCWRNWDGAYNCGRCEKCLRTMIDLRAAGVLERCKTLPSNIDLEAVASLDLSSGVLMPLARERLRALERLGTEPELTRALAEAIIKSTEASEGRFERAGRKRLQKQLSQTQKELERTRTELEVSRGIVDRLRARNQRLTKRYDRLAGRPVSRRYKLADTLVGGALRIPGLSKLVRRQSPADD